MGFPTLPFGWTVAPVTGEAKPQRDHVCKEVKTRVPPGHEEPGVHGDVQWAVPVGISAGAQEGDPSWKPRILKLF